MSDLKKLTKMNREVYAMIFLIGLSLVLLESYYSCWVYGSYNLPYGDSLEAKIAQSVEEQRDKAGNYSLPDEGLDMSEAISLKFKLEGGSILVPIAVIILLLMFRESQKSSVRSREYESFLPVRRTSVVMHDYFSMAAIIVFVNFIQGIIYWIYQNHYDSLWVKASGLSEPAGFRAGANDRLITYVVIYTLYLLFIYTWLYLGIVVSKNELLGIFYSAFTRFTVCIPLMIICGLFIDRSALGGAAKTYINAWTTLLARPMVAIDKYTCVGLLKGSIDISQYEFTDWREYETLGHFNPIEYNNIDIRSYLLVVLALTIVGVFLIRLFAKKRELTRGGRFSYFKPFDYVIAIYSGIIVWLIDGFLELLNDYFDLYLDDAIVGVLDGNSIILGILTTVVLILIGRSIDTNRLKDKIGIEEKEKSDDPIVLKKAVISSQNTLYIILLLTLVLVTLAVAGRHFNILDEQSFTESTIALQKLDYLEWFSGNLISIFKKEYVILATVCLIIFRMRDFWDEKNIGVREFKATLPISRSKAYLANVLRDVVLVSVPAILSAIYVYFRLASEFSKAGIEAGWIAVSVFGLMITGWAYTMMLIGFIHLVEEFFANGMTRFFALIGSSFMAFICMQSLYDRFAGRNPIIEIIYGTAFNMLSGGYSYSHHSHGISDIDMNILGVPFSDYAKEYISEYSGYGLSDLSALYDFSKAKYYLGFVALYALIAILLIAVGFIMESKKDYSRHNLYFNFEKYIIAGAFAATFLCVTLATAFDKADYIRISIVSMIVFILIVLFFSKDRLVRMKKCIRVKK